ncbi:MAG: class A beta-lactamase-related serine hydrolase [Thermoplasmata archaeon]|nr:class A beta-lactamase-related serine hydrolase [Thermoplasmata archaeon]
MAYLTEMIPCGVICMVAKKSKDELSELKQEVLGLMKKVPGSMGVYIKHIERHEEISIEAEKIFPLGSIFQIPIMVEVFRQVEKQRLSLDDKIELTDGVKSVGSGILQFLSPGLTISVTDLLVLMMTVSDNTATDILWKKIGVQSVNMMLRELGFTRTNCYIPNREYYLLSLLLGQEFEGMTMSELVQSWKNKSQMDKSRSMAAIDLKYSRTLPIEEFRTRYEAMYGRRGEKRFQQKRSFDEVADNQGSPREIGSLLEKIFLGEVASPNFCQKMLGIMLLRQDENMVSFLLPAEIPVSGKGGWLAGTCNDAGIVYVNPKSHFVIACLARKLNHGDETKASDIIEKISKKVYDYYSHVSLGKP